MEPDLSIIDHFALPGQQAGITEIETGHINSTHRLRRELIDGKIKHFILQRINPDVFKDASAVMRNVQLVTEHLAEKEDSEFTLHLIPTGDGKTHYTAEDGAIWRCYNAIEECTTYDVVESKEQAFEAAFAFGRFQAQLADLDASSLTETIPDFHDTPKRYKALLAAIAADSKERVALAAPEIEFIEERADQLAKLIEAENLPSRITHNDTKLNNVMIHTKTNKAVCVIDLDTVMPGTALYDFGDLVRTAAASAPEDETDLSRVLLYIPYFEAVVEGYLQAAGASLTEEEIALLAFSGKLITLELAIRFLTDYLEGDHYFKTQYPSHNLDRARNQLALVASMEEQRFDLDDIVEEVAARVRPA